MGKGKQKADPEEKAGMAQGKGKENMTNSTPTLRMSTPAQPPMEIQSPRQEEREIRNLSSDVTNPNAFPKKHTAARHMTVHSRSGRPLCLCWCPKLPW